MSEGTRTLDSRNHNPELYRLSYTHHTVHHPPYRVIAIVALRLVRLEGFEPPAYRSGICRSIQLSYRRTAFLSMGAEF